MRGRVDHIFVIKISDRLQKNLIPFPLKWVCSRYLYFTFWINCQYFIFWQCLPGRPTREALRCICRPTPPSWSCSTAPSRSRRRTSKRNRGTAFWRRYTGCALMSQGLQCSSWLKTSLMMFVLCVWHSVRRWRAPGCTATGAAAGPDRGLRGVLSSRRCAEGAWEGRGSLQVWGGRAHQQPHCKDRRRKKTLVCSFYILSHFVCLYSKKNLLLSLVYLGLLLEGRLLGIQVLPLDGQTELLHRTDWNWNSKY